MNKSSVAAVVLVAALVVTALTARSAWAATGSPVEPPGAADGVFNDSNSDAAGGVAELFEAEVIEVLDSRQVEVGNGATITQQDLRLRGATGQWRGSEVTVRGIGEAEVVGVGTYQVGDRVMVQSGGGPDGEPDFIIVDYVRRGPLYVLAVAFALIVALVGRRRGLRALLSLIVSFLILMAVVLPRILAGGSPLWWGLTGAFVILLVNIYVTEGWQMKSHLASLSVLGTLVITYFLGAAVTTMSHLTGLAQEEAGLLLGFSRVVDFRGLLLAGIVLGCAGVLDDIVIGQIEAVQQLANAKPTARFRERFRAAYEIGNAHLGAVINTLFLTYAGASLPLLLLFLVRQPPFESFGQVLNNELVATEVVRALVGSCGVALSVPLTTALAVWRLRPEKGAPVGNAGHADGHHL